ncbi:MAG: hypothetical protein Q7S02_03100 [bacterium]|nr:hypothetical protein [bacterium]
MPAGITRINVAFPNRTLRELRRAVARGAYSRFVARAVEVELARCRSSRFLRGRAALRVTADHPFWDALAASATIERGEQREARRRRR